LDVIITASGRDTIFRTIESFLTNVKYAGEFRFIINIDVCRKGSLTQIIKYVKNLNLKYFNVNYQPKGFTNALSSTLKQIESTFYFHLEDDWVFLKEIQLDPLIELLQKNNNVNHVRFSKRKIRDYNELFYCPPLRGIYRPKKKNIVIDGIQLVNCIAYSANPNISRTSHFQNKWCHSFDILVWCHC